LKGGFTTKLNVVVLLSGLPVTVIGNVPVGVAPVVLIVSWLEHVGVHAPGLNPAVAPLGSPETKKETLWVEPAVRVAVIVLEPEPPKRLETFTVMSPEFVSV
jgi:hypothetical protein